MPDIFWKRPCILAQYAEGIKLEEIRRITSSRVDALRREHWEHALRLFSQLPSAEDLVQRGREVVSNLYSDAVSIGGDEDLSESESLVLQEAIRALIPWRKGPFSLFGHFIDSEWQSNLKWDRISPHLPELDGKRVADIGCGNAYYMFRLFGEAMHRGEVPECIIGMDPSESFYLAFELFQRFLQRPEISYELLGVEHIGFFPKFFDIILCLGVIYHQRDPLTMLQNIRGAMRPGGVLLLESQAIPGDEPVALFAPERYAKARNTYFIPTAECLRAWAERAGFSDTRIVSSETLCIYEQRQTALAPYESFVDFLDPADASKTCEGFPAPKRVVVLARN